MHETNGIYLIKREVTNKVDERDRCSEYHRNVLENSKNELIVIEAIIATSLIRYNNWIKEKKLRGGTPWDHPLNPKKRRQIAEDWNINNRRINEGLAVNKIWKDTGCPRIEPKDAHSLAHIFCDEQNTHNEMEVKYSCSDPHMSPNIVKVTCTKKQNSMEWVRTMSTYDPNSIPPKGTYPDTGSNNIICNYHWGAWEEWPGHWEYETFDTGYQCNGCLYDNCRGVKSRQRHCARSSKDSDLSIDNQKCYNQPGSSISFITQNVPNREYIEEIYMTEYDCCHNHVELGSHQHFRCTLANSDKVAQCIPCKAKCKYDFDKCQEKESTLCEWVTHLCKYEILNFMKLSDPGKPDASYLEWFALDVMHKVGGDFHKLGYIDEWGRCTWIDLIRLNTMVSKRDATFSHIPYLRYQTTEFNLHGVPGGAMKLHREYYDKCIEKPEPCKPSTVTCNWKDFCNICGACFCKLNNNLRHKYSEICHKENECYSYCGM